MGVSPPCVLGGWDPAWGHLQSCLPWSRILWDNTSVSSAGLGEEAVGSDSLLIADGSRDSSEEDTSMWDLAGLHMHVRHDKKQ